MPLWLFADIVILFIVLYFTNCPSLIQYNWYLDNWLGNVKCIWLWEIFCSYLWLSLRRIIWSHSLVTCRKHDRNQNRKFVLATGFVALGRLKHDDVIKWKHFPRYWPFVRGIHRSPVNFPHSQRPVTRSFDIFFDLRLNKRLSRQSWGWWYETLSCPLWRQCNGLSNMLIEDFGVKRAGFFSTIQLRHLDIFVII